ncbi:MAG: hypothetical protein WBC91_13525 [Phototrophicaceae bacterium]
MREPDLHYEAQINGDIEDATQNLSENLHLKWQYGLLFVDKYSDEQNLPVSIVSGIRRDDETTYYIRVHLMHSQKSTYSKIDIWKVVTSGWPFPTGVVNMGTAKSDKLIDMVDDILNFCQQPYEHTTGVFPWLRNMFTGRTETRQYKD